MVYHFKAAHRDYGTNIFFMGEGNNILWILIREFIEVATFRSAIQSTRKRNVLIIWSPTTGCVSEGGTNWNTVS